MKKGFVFLAVLLFAVILISGCAKPTEKPTIPTTPQVTTANETKPKCPASCDDNNKCTSDLCSAATNYDCEHKEIVPCCGNNICETGEKETDTCPEDCPKEENVLLKELIVKAENVKSYKYTFDDGSEQITFAIKGNLTKESFLSTKKYNNFLYDSVLINKTSGYAYLYCTARCDSKTARKISDYSRFLRITPVELIKSIKTAKKIDEGIVEGNKPSVVLEFSREDGNKEHITVWEVSGLPLIDEIKDAEGSTVSKTSYKDMQSPLLEESFSLPLGITISG